MLRNTLRLAVAAVVAGSGWACQNRERMRTEQARIDSLSTAVGDRDRMVAELAENARLVSVISAELAKVRVPPKTLRVSAESPLRAQRDSLVQTIRYVAARVNELEPRLRASERRLREMTTLSDSLRQALETTMTNYQTVIESQKVMIAELTDQVSELTTAKVALQDSLGTVTRRENTVYYVVGTKQELMDRGILVEEGGARFLFVLWKQGETLAPARDLDPSAFTAINKRETTQIPLPDAAGEYRVASRHDLEYLATPPAKGTTIHGTPELRIAQPEQFWATSKFLIVVQS